MQDGDLVPPFPEAPPGRSRLDDPATVAAGLRYWRSALARSQPGTSAEVVAAAMVEVYRAARESMAAVRRSAGEAGEAGPPAPPR